MKTDVLFYQIFQNFPQIFFELVGETNIDPYSYQFISPEIKQTAFRLDGVFIPTSANSDLPLYFVEVQFQKKDNFYSRLFTEIFLYFYQQELDTEWYASNLQISTSRSGGNRNHARIKSTERN